MEFQLREWILSFFCLICSFFFTINELKAQQIDSLFYQTVLDNNLQPSQLDSLSKILLQSEQTDEFYKKTSLKIAENLRRGRKYKESVDFINQLLTKKPFQNDLQSYSKLNTSLGSAYFRLKKDSLCLEAYQNAMNGFRTIKDTVGLVKVYANYATINSSFGNFRMALDLSLIHI